MVLKYLYSKFGLSEFEQSHNYMKIGFASKMYSINIPTAVLPIQVFL